jgi:TRAP-type C4-dicarboxylate transport system permease small subunit
MAKKKEELTKIDKILEIIEKLKNGDKIIIKILKYITITVFVLIMLIMTANVVIRQWSTILSNIISAKFYKDIPAVIQNYILLLQNKTTPSLHWLDEIIEMLFAALVFYGAAALWFTKGHFSSGDYISRHIKNLRIRNIYRLLLELMVLFFLSLFLYYGFNLFLRASDVTNALQIPKNVLYSSMPISGLIMVYCIVKNVIVEIIGVIKPEAVKEILEKKIS